MISNVGAISYLHQSSSNDWQYCDIVGFTSFALLIYVILLLSLDALFHIFCVIIVNNLDKTVSVCIFKSAAVIQSNLVYLATSYDADMMRTKTQCQLCKRYFKRTWCTRRRNDVVSISFNISMSNLNTIHTSYIMSYRCLSTLRC